MLLRTEVVQSQLAKEWLTGSPFEPCANAYIQSLTERGYLPSTVALYFSSVAHLAHWGDRRSILPTAIDESVVTRFMRQHLPACKCATRCMRRRHIVRTALALFLKSMRSAGTIPLLPSSPRDAITIELDGFDRHLHEAGGLADSTRRIHLRNVEHFLKYFFHRKPMNVEGLAPKDVVQFVQKQATSHGWRPVTIKAVTGSIRSYFKFKAIFGVDTVRLSAALPRIARWRLSQLPKMVLPDQGASHG